ncbi:spore coat protein U domain-containing protein [Escherichia coli]|nr:hypothetical protein HMPREF0986_00901 [Escherichia coli 4_1_47FAA]EHV3000327.1 spore coat protein U domain-containing protein [Escherichia coli]EIH0551680.1 spore coat protein U domain-containing protein [Escherichia coli]MBC0551273.1 spore coat protein U domain-containing protein [Escherichia coli]HBA9131659.1 fimbrial major subunit CsuA/B family protein [Escherichia coli]
MKKIIFLLALTGISVSSSVHANYRWFLFEPKNDVFRDIDVTYDDYTVSATATMTSSLSGWFPGKVIRRACSGGPDSLPASQQKTGWIAIPTREIQSGGLKFKAEPVLSGAWRRPDFSYPATYSMTVNQITKQTPLDSCWTLGATVSGVDWWAPAASVKLIIPKQSVPAGVYNVSIPYKYAYEEHKHAGSIYPGSSIISEVLSVPDKYINARVTVVSKCDISTKSINLSHGEMAGRLADKNKTRPYNVNLTCREGTSVSVKLTGSHTISGKTENFTRCGDGGVCELLFNDGNGDKYKDTFRISGTKTLAVTSTYHLNDISHPVAGSFTGSGIMQILVN